MIFAPKSESLARVDGCSKFVVTLALVASILNLKFAKIMLAKRAVDKFIKHFFKMHFVIQL